MTITRQREKPKNNNTTARIMLVHYEETRNGSEKNQKRNREQMRKQTRAYLRG